MKKKDKAICKYKKCQKEFDRKDVARVYGELSSVFQGGYCSAICYTRDTVKIERASGFMDEEGVLEVLLTNLNALHCHKCGKSADEFVKGKECLLGCLSYTIEDIGEFLYWTCPKCMKGVKE